MDRVSIAIMANLDYAARCGQHIHIGGGIFTPQEVRKFVSDMAEASSSCAEFHRYLEKKEKPNGSR